MINIKCPECEYSATGDNDLRMHREQQHGMAPNVDGVEADGGTSSNQESSTYSQNDSSRSQSGSRSNEQRGQNKNK